MKRLFLPLKSFVAKMRAFNWRPKITLREIKTEKRGFQISLTGHEGKKVSIGAVRGNQQFMATKLILDRKKLPEHLPAGKSAVVTVDIIEPNEILPKRHNVTLVNSTLRDLTFEEIKANRIDSPRDPVTNQFKKKDHFISRVQVKETVTSQGKNGPTSKEVLNYKYFIFLTDK